MYYPNDEWIPLRDIADMVDRVWRDLGETDAAVLPDEESSPRVGEGHLERADEEDRQLVSLVWRVCDACQAATLTKKGKLIFLSKSLFTRRSNASVYGDFVKIDLGQIGSGQWISSQDEFEDDKRKNVIPPVELEMLLYPFYQHHILIRRTDLEAFMNELRAVEQTATVEKRKPGRPAMRYGFMEYYKEKYPNGHIGVPINKVIRDVHEAGGPKIGLSTFHDIFRVNRNQKAKSPE